MQRQPINPWPWSQQVGYHQAEIIQGSQRQLICAGQTSVDSHGKPLHLDDMRQQVMKALDNLEAVLEAAEMGLADIVRLNIYTTNVDEAMKHFDILGARFRPVKASPPMTLLGVTQLALPGLMFEVEATAAS